MSPSSNLRVVRESLTAQDLTPAFWDELWAFVTTYVSRSRPAFEAAVPQYAYLSVWRDRTSGRMLGFAANNPIPLQVEGRNVVVIYSGWAILAPEVRGLNLLQVEGLRCFAHSLLRYPGRPAFWVFGASTFKSYLVLPRNFRTYFPRREQPWSAFHLAIRDGVMAAVPDPHWDPAAGVVHRHGASRYQEGVVEDDPAVLADPDIAFYAGANPKQGEGDTLMVVAPLSLSNWLSMAASSVARLKRRSRRSAGSPSPAGASGS